MRKFATLLSGFLLVTCSLSAFGESSKPIGSFWQWFTTNQKKLYDMKSPDQALMGDMESHLRTINKQLQFEIIPIPGKHVLAISADGHSDIFPVVKQVVSQSPTLDNWKVVAFRQPMPPEALKAAAIGAHRADGGPPVKMAVKDMRYSIHRNGDKADITVYVQGVKEPQVKQFMTHQMLLQALGEYDLATRVGKVTVEDRTPANDKTSKPFDGMHADLNALFASKPAATKH